MAEDGTVDINVLGNDSDPDGDTLSVASVTQGAHGTVVINPDKTVKYTPAANYNGLGLVHLHGFGRQRWDGDGDGDDHGDRGQRRAGRPTPTPATVAEDGTVNIGVLGNDTDPDGDILTVTAVTQGAHGAVVINPDKTVKYTPAANYNGPDAFTYTISDGNGGTATATVTINVTPSTTPPVADERLGDGGRRARRSPSRCSPTTRTSTAPSLSVTGVTQGAHGTVVINADQTVTYTAGLYVGHGQLHLHGLRRRGRHRHGDRQP